MPADLSRFTLAIDSIGGASIRVFFYLSEDDRDTVLSGGYFDGGMELGLAVNDMIYVADLNNPGTTYDLRVVSASDYTGEVVVQFAFQEYVDTLRPFATIDEAKAGVSTTTVLNPAGGAALIAEKFPELLAATDFSIWDFIINSVTTVGNADIGGDANVDGDLNVGGLLLGANYDIAKTGSVPQPIIRRFDRCPWVTDFNCKGDDATDDTDNFQRAVEYAEVNGLDLYIPSVASGYKLSDTIYIDKGLHLSGVYPRPLLEHIYPTSTRGPGSWLHFAHSGHGISSAGLATNTISGLHIEKIGTYRDQPDTTGGSFTPNDHDWDFLFETTDVIMNHVMLHNPTRGIYAHQGGNGYGSIYLDHIQGQPLNEGIRLQDQFRQCGLNNINFWTYWASTPSVIAYMLANKIGLDIFTQDGIQCTNFFSIWNHMAMRFSGGEAGDNQPGRGALRCQFTNTYIDFSQYGIYINSNSNEMSAVFNNTVLFGANPTVTGSYGIVNTGNSTKMDFTNLEASNFGGSGLYSPGTGYFNLVNMRSESWNVDNLGSTLIEAAAGTTVQYSPIISANGNGASNTGGAGTFVPF